MDPTRTAPKPAVSTLAAKLGTCPICRQSIPIVNYAIERGYEVGYVGRHSRPGIAATSKCRGSFGYWVEKSR